MKVYVLLELRSDYEETGVVRGVYLDERVATLAGMQLNGWTLFEEYELNEDRSIRQ